MECYTKLLSAVVEGKQIEQKVDYLKKNWEILFAFIRFSNESIAFTRFSKNSVVRTKLLKDPATFTRFKKIFQQNLKN